MTSERTARAQGVTKLSSGHVYALGMICLWLKILAQLPFRVLWIGHGRLQKRSCRDVQEGRKHFLYRTSDVEQRVVGTWNTSSSSTVSETHKVAYPALNERTEGGEIVLGEEEDSAHWGSHVHCQRQ